MFAMSSRFSDICILQDHMEVHLNRQIHRNESLTKARKLP